MDQTKKNRVDLYCQKLSEKRKEWYDEKCRGEELDPYKHSTWSADVKLFVKL